MKKVRIFIAIFVLISVFAIGYVLGLKSKAKEKINIEPKFVGLEKNLTEISKDTDFYKNLDKYESLLNDNDYEYLKEKTEKIMSNEEDFNNLFIPITMNELFKDEKTKNIIIALRDNVYSVKNKILTKEEENELFEKNTACSNLVSEISKHLINKEETSALSKTTQKEKLDFVFYSSKMKACIYSTGHLNRYDNYTDYKRGYTIYNKIIYNGSTQSKINEFRVYSFYNDLSDSESRSKEEQNNQRNYYKFILENSNYNIDLLQNVSFYPSYE